MKILTTHKLEHCIAAMVRNFALLSLLLFAQAASAITFTQNTTISATDTTYDGQDVVISGATVTIDGAHTFNTLTITANGVVTTSIETKLEVTAITIQIDTGSSINVVGLGKLPVGATGSSGGSYGGLGGVRSSAYVTNATYGNYRQPVDFGAGGDSASGSSYDTRGGGALKLVADELVLDGGIYAYGGYSAWSGGGSGGSVWLDVGVLRGTGAINANGRAGGSSDSSNGGGGGGRIAIYYTDASGFDFNNASAYGAYASNTSTSAYGQYGAPGTVYLKAASDAVGSIKIASATNISGRAYTELAGIYPESITVNMARVLIAEVTNVESLVVDTGEISTNGSQFTINGTLTLQNSSKFTVSTVEQVLDVKAKTIQIDASSSINVSGQGKLPAGATSNSGGSYGGLGGVRSSAYVTNATYGDYRQPVDFGTGGDSASGTPYDTRGGGALKLVADELMLDGYIYAYGSYNVWSGGGSGGSVWLDVGVLRGTGAINANGISGGSSDSTTSGGGGGRIAIYYTDASGFDLTGRVVAYGGIGRTNGQQGGAGTIYLKAANSAVGTLQIASPSYIAASAYTPLPGTYTEAVTAKNTRVLVSSATNIETLTVDGSEISTNGSQFTINGTLTLQNSSKFTVSTVEQVLDVKAKTIQIDASSSINVSGQGKLPAGATSNSGGSYGGLGGVRSSAYVTNATYGDYRQPVDFGTGGDSASGTPYDTRGGGALKLVADELMLDGYIYAYGSYNVWSGGGSGGSVWLDVGVLRGTGAINANGISGGSSDSTTSGGGGGRIAIYYTDASGFDLTGRVVAYGGIGRTNGQQGGAGTIYLKAANSAVGTLQIASPSYVAASAYTTLSSVAPDNLVIASANVKFDDVVTALESLTVTNTGLARVAGDSLTVNGTIVLSSAGRLVGYSRKILDVTAKTIQIDVNSQISVNGLGMLPSAVVTGSSGGSYGGLGGVYGSYTTNPVYGDPLQPIDVGTGGNSASGNTYDTRGGGALKLAADELVVDGSIYANGDWDLWSGGGSGGSIWLDVGVLRGLGAIQARGGNRGANDSTSSGGGGGRIAIYYSDASGFDLVNKISVIGGIGGTSGQPGQPGTIHLSGKNVPPYVLSHAPDGITNITVDKIQLRFSNEINLATLTSNTLSVVDGADTSYSPQANRVSATEYTLDFATPLSDGDYTVTLDPAITGTNGFQLDQNRNGVGGEATDGYSFTFTVDTTPPSVVTVADYVIAPELNIVTTRQLTLSGTRPADTSIWINDILRLGTGGGSTDWSFALTLSEGANTLRIQAGDAAGNLSDALVLEFVADTTAPVVSAVQPSDGSFLSDHNPAITLNYVETGAGIDLAQSTLSVTSNGISIAGEWIDAGNGILTFSPALSLLDGVYTIDATLKDKAGHLSAQHVSSFTIDTISPPATVLVNPPDTSTINTVTISGSKEADSLVVWKNNFSIVVDGWGANTSWSYNIPLVAGDNVLTFAVRDRAGNESPVTTHTVRYDDTTPGAVAVTATNVGDGVSLSLDWSTYDEWLQGNDIASYAIYIESAAFTDVSALTAHTTRAAGIKQYKATGLTRDQQYFIAVVASDTSGNALTTVTPITATPTDNKAPDEAGGLSVSQSLADQLTVNWTASPDSGGDLANYRLYVDGALSSEVTKDVLTATVSGLTAATGYQLSLRTVDTSGNESVGINIDTATLLPNPTGLASTAHSGKVDLSWNAVVPANLVKSYAIYAETTPFTSVTGLTPKLVVAGSKTASVLAGLTDDVTYTLAVTARNISGGESKSVTPITDTPHPDRTGPVINSIQYNSVALNDGDTLSASGIISVTATDPAGIGRVEFIAGGQLLGSDTNGKDGYGMALDLLSVVDGALTIDAVAYDTLDNATPISRNVTIALAAPAAPQLTAPTDGLITNQSTVTVQGTAEKTSSIILYQNGTEAGTTTTDTTGHFQLNVTLVEGANALTATASNRGGVSIASAAITVTLDTTIPESPTGLQASAGEQGVVSLSWLNTNDKRVVGYDVYRSSAAFTEISQAVKINSSLLKSARYSDMPAADGEYFYRVVARNSLNTASVPSAQVSAVADNTAPHIVAIDYAPAGLTDPTSGAFAAGNVGITVHLNEPLLTKPFLSFSTSGGLPMLVNLIQDDDVTYHGSIAITQYTKSGTAYAVFSARDMVGNRGTEVLAGGSFLIDTTGPRVTKLAVVPGSPIKNDAASPATVTAEITLNEAVKVGTFPDLSYQLSGAGRLATPITLIAISDTLWRGDFVLPSDAGAAEVETLSFAYSGSDELNNLDTTIDGNNSFQVYQGNLPPLAAPASLKATVKPGGQIHLSWNAVAQAVGYQVYRQGPGEVSATPLQRLTATVMDDYVTDGAYTYTVASIRSENGQESFSGPSNAVTVTADAIAPPAPQNLTLQLVGSGIQAIWDAPTGLTETVTYNVYRSSGGSITSIVGMTPIQTNLGANSQGILAFIDRNPDINAPTYAVTAVDGAGNESGPSPSQYINIELLPVKTLSVSIPENDYPTVRWTHSSSTIASYRVYLDGGSTPITETTGLSYQDTGYTGGDRRYTVTAVDSFGKESIGRTVQLTNLELGLPTNAVIKRGIFNRLEYSVTNPGTTTQTNVTVRSLINGAYYASTKINLGAGESGTVSMVVSGHETLPSVLPVTAVLTATSLTDESVSQIKSHELTVGDSKMTLAVETQQLKRGVPGKVRFTLNNPGAVEAEIITATGNGYSPSNEVRINLIDVDGNLLTTAPVQLFSGTGIDSASGGLRLARVPGNGSFTSDWIDVNIPESAPDLVTVELVVDNFHYHTGAAGHVTIAGMTGSVDATLHDMPYSATIDSITPQSSLGDEPIVIAGRALDTVGNPVATVPVKLVVVNRGFERPYSVTTDAAGGYSYNFSPMNGESGSYTVSAIHPEVLARPGQGHFSISKITMFPATYNLYQAYSLSKEYSEILVTVGGINVSQLRLEPEQALPNGITLTLPAPVDAIGGSKVSLPFTFAGSTSAQATGSIPLKLVSDTTGATILAKVSLNYNLSQANPILNFSPTLINTGVVHDGSVSNSVTLRNNGYAPMNDVSVKLVTANGTTPPDWIYMISDGTPAQLDIGASRKVSLTAAPSSAVTEGVYPFKLRVSSSNYAVTDINVYVTVTQSGIGNVLFKASDIYTATLDGNGNPIPGLAGAHIRVQNETVYSVEATLDTDSLGEAMFKDLPAGRYQYRASAPNHTDVTGRFTITPGITEAQEVFLDSNLVTVEWSVTETTIQDTYEIVLTTTFETDVPAAVVVIEPGSVTLPNMAVGEIYYGAIRLTNHGLIRADNLTFNLPGEDAYFRYEFPDGLPTSLQAYESVLVPYRVVAVASLGATGAASGGGCSPGYNNRADVGYNFTCANGHTSSGSGSHTWTRPATGCGGGTGGGGGTGNIYIPPPSGGSAGNGPPGTSGSGSTSGTMGPPPDTIAPDSCPNDCQGCACSGGGGGGPGW